MADLFGDPKLFEEFEKEPVTKFGSKTQTNGSQENWEEDEEEEEQQPWVEEQKINYESSLFKIPPELNREVPGLQLVILNNPKFIKRRAEIEQFFSKLLQQEDEEKNIADIPKPLPTSLNVGPGYENPDSWQTMGCLQLFADFILDSHGQPLVLLTPELSEGWDIPAFERFIEKCLPVEEEEGVIPKGVRKGRCCFNCGEESHGIADCPLPKNMKEIQRRKAEIRRAQDVPTLSGNKAKIGVDVDPRFKNFKPGQIGKDLKEALGCGDSKLPPYIYQMRRLGYPPGWLEEAKLTFSGVTMIDGEGVEMRADGYRVEDGEVETGQQGEAKEFQLSKLVEFPGFNIALPQGVTDESRRFNALTFSRHQSLDRMRDEFAKTNDNLKRRYGLTSDSSDEGKPQKKRQRESSEVMAPPGTEALSAESRDSSDMELSEDERVFVQPPLPKGCPPPSTPPAPLPTSTPPVTPKTPQTTPPFKKAFPKSPASKAEKSTDQSDEDSVIVLDESEKEDGFVVDELEEGEMSPTPSPTKQTVDTDPPFSPPRTPNLPLKTPSDLKSPSISLNSISMSHGTPIPCRFDVSDLEAGDAVDLPRQYESDPSVNPTMPTPDQWAKNVSEHMDFENLPNTEGRFKLIKKLVEKGKKFLKR